MARHLDYLTFLLEEMAYFSNIHVHGCTDLAQYRALLRTHYRAHQGLTPAQER